MRGLRNLLCLPVFGDHGKVLAPHSTTPRPVDLDEMLAIVSQNREPNVWTVVTCIVKESRVRNDFPDKSRKSTNRFD